MIHALVLLIVAALVTGLWLASLPLRDASIADVFWGLGFIATAFATLALAPERTEQGWLVAGLVSLWGLRLAAYLAWRNWGRGEDARYRAMREYHGARFWWVSLGTVFWLQGLLIWVVSWPLRAAILAPASAPAWHWLDAVGLALFAVGLACEATGDWQLARFKADPANRGRVCERGLWRYTRHPNYFGDFLVWWGFYAIALSSGAWWTIVAPIVMSWLLLRVSGVTLLERTIVERRPDYAEYIRRTNAFFPGRPKSFSPPAE